MGHKQDMGVPDLLVEQLSLGELSTERAAQVTRALEAAGGDGSAQRGPAYRRLEALRASDEEILATYPATEQVAGIHRRALAAKARQRRARRTLWIGSAAVVAAAAAAVVLIVVGPWSGPVGDELPGFLDGPDTTRIKGLQPTLEIYRQEGAEAIRLRDAETAHAGDLLQLSYVAAGHTHGVIYSIDGDGTVTLHFPERLQGSTALEPDGRTPLKHAYELDDAPRFERFVFVAAESDLEAEAVLDTLAAVDLASLEEAPPGDLPPGWEISVVTLVKEGE